MWGVEGRARSARRRAVVLAVVLAPLGAAPAQAAAPPSVSITSPVAGATVKGTVPVTASATAASGDTMSSIDFYDGVNYLGNVGCQGQSSCTVTWNWRATGLSDAHTLTARAYARSGAQATSAGVTVMVVTPPPGVTITAPAATATVKGTVTITAGAATDPALDDYPTAIDFFDGANYLGERDCQGQTTCSASYDWAATGKTGPHTLTAKVYTHQGDSSVSAPVTVNVVTPKPTVRIVKPAAGTRLGGTLTVRAAAATDPALDDYPTAVTLLDGTSQIGSFDCQGQDTCAGSIRWSTAGLKGSHALRAVVYTHQGDSARSKAVLVGAHRRTRAAVSCTLTTRRARQHQLVRGTCSVPGLPAGTRVTIKYRTGSGPYQVAASLKSGANGFHFHLRGSKRATFRLVVVIAANRRYRATAHSLGTLRIV